MIYYQLAQSRVVVIVLKIEERSEAHQYHGQMATELSILSPNSGRLERNQCVALVRPQMQMGCMST